MRFEVGTYDVRGDVLRWLREFRRDFHAVVTSSIALRERLFLPDELFKTLRDHIARSSRGTLAERRSRLLVLATLLYAALDWHFAGHGVEIEADVQIERMRQDEAHGPDDDDRLGPEEWSARLRQQLARLEQHLPPSETYGTRLIKLTALAQAALEAAYRTTALRRVAA